LEDDAHRAEPKFRQCGLLRGGIYRSVPGEQCSIMDFPLAGAKSLAWIQRRHQD
jgi:hypothetical protein